MNRELREPDLPRTAKVRTGTLRPGWTTGTCASAAAKAAAILLSGGDPPGEVEVALGNGHRHRFPVERSHRAGGAPAASRDEEAQPPWAEAVVVKDAGDDPDATDGARLTVRLEWAGRPGVIFRAGEGVGTVTKPGLGLDVGDPAINPVPRRVIAQAVAEVFDTEAHGVVCTISVPGGQQMARKTTNRRLGILGGISILGTSGVVRPFSTASWRASVVQAVDVLAAQGGGTLVLSTGGRTERAAMALLPDLEDGCFVEVGDFTGAALRRAADRGLRQACMVAMAGKLTKLAAGVLMTHYTRSKVDTGLLAEITAEAGGDQDVVAAVRAANTARHACELWRAHDVRGAPGVLCARVADNLTRFTGGKVTAHAAMVDFDSLQPVGFSPGWARGWGPSSGKPEAPPTGGERRVRAVPEAPPAGGEMT